MTEIADNTELDRAAIIANGLAGIRFTQPEEQTSQDDYQQQQRSKNLY